MSNITWKQLREKVEAELKKQGVNEDIEIEYIDFSWVYDIEQIDIYIDEGMVVIQ